MLPPLAAAVAAGRVLERIADLCREARAVGVPVLHCTAETRPDGLGGNRNARLFAVARRAGPAPRPGSPSFDVHPAVGVEPADFVLSRLHGLSPLAGTSLDAILRNLGVRTIVATGVSVNIGITGLAMVAVDLGYQVVLVTDAVAGVPRDYAAAVVEHTLAPLTTRLSTEAIVTAWAS